MASKFNRFVRNDSTDPHSLLVQKLKSVKQTENALLINPKRLETRWGPTRVFGVCTLMKLRKKMPS